MIWNQLPQFLVSGITSGSIYALIALGFGIIHNATGIVNFAQGEFVMLGAMAMISFTGGMGMPIFVAFPLAVLIVMGVGDTPDLPNLNFGHESTSVLGCIEADFCTQIPIIQHQFFFEIYIISCSSSGRGGKRRVSYQKRVVE